MQSDIIRVENKFGAKQLIFMCKSVVEVWYTIRNWNMSRSSGWSDVVGWA